MDRSNATRREVARLCHVLEEESRGGDGDVEGLVWASFSDRRSLTLDLGRFYERSKRDVVVLVAPDAPQAPQGMDILSLAHDDPLVQAWEFGVVVGTYAAFLRAEADGPPATSRDSPDRRLQVSVTHGAEAARSMSDRVEAVTDRLPADRVHRARDSLRLMLA